MELSFSIQHTIEEPLKFNRDLINFDMCLDIKKNSKVYLISFWGSFVLNYMEVYQYFKFDVCLGKGKCVQTSTIDLGVDKLN